MATHKTRVPAVFGLQILCRAGRALSDCGNRRLIRRTLRFLSSPRTNRLSPLRPMPGDDPDAYVCRHRYTRPILTVKSSVSICWRRLNTKLLAQAHVTSLFCGSFCWNRRRRTAPLQILQAHRQRRDVLLSREH